MGHVVLALPGAEVDQIHALVGDEAVDGRHEGLRDRVHEHRGHEREPPVELEEAHHPEIVLQTRLVEVEVHPVDALDFQRDVVAEDIGHAAG